MKLVAKVKEPHVECERIEINRRVSLNEKGKAIYTPVYRYFVYLNGKRVVMEQKEFDSRFKLVEQSAE